MGIRMWRSMGFSLNDVKPDDPRINWDTVNSDDFYEESPSDAYDKWLKKSYPAHEDESIILYNVKVWTKDIIDLQQCVQYLGEDTESNIGQEDHVLMVVPPGFLKKGRRFSDDMDYSDYAQFHPERFEQMEGLVYETPLPPLGWERILIDRETKKQVRNDGALRFKRTGQQEAYLPDSFLLKDTPYTSIAELEEKTKVVPPMELRALSMYLKLFTNDDVWEDLQPTVATHFS